MVIDLFLSFFKIGFFNLLAFGCIAAAVVIRLGLNQVPILNLIPVELRRIAAVSFLLVSAFSFGTLYGLDTTKQQLRQLQKQLSINAKIIEASTKREARAIKENQDMADLLKQIEQDFKSSGNSCSADTEYTASMNKILSRIRK